jgi:CBS domain-containing protein
LGDDHGFTCLPVVGQGGLAGMITRGDVLSVFGRTDADIRSEIVRKVLLGYFLADPATFGVSVSAATSGFPLRHLGPDLDLAVGARDGHHGLMPERRGHEGLVTSAAGALSALSLSTTSTTPSISQISLMATGIRS